MDLLVMLLAATLFPLAGLGFLLWMAHYEDGLPAAVRRSALTPEPPPILGIPVRPQPTRAPMQAVVRLPAQRSEVSRSAEASLGGSTNR